MRDFLKYSVVALVLILPVGAAVVALSVPFMLIVGVLRVGKADAGSQQSYKPGVNRGESWEISRKVSGVNPEDPKSRPIGPALSRVQDLMRDGNYKQIEERVKNLAGAEIQLWGRVCDEDGIGLPGVEIAWSLVYAPSTRIKSGKCVSDSAGQFYIGGVNGPMVHLSPFRVGWRAKENTGGTWFADLPTSPENPLKLLMVKNL